jgi:MerR HTH family regulatory protein
MEEPRWTLDELAERVDAALAVDYPGQPSGRVRDVPDRRAIRWYTTIGLIDRPVAHRGRTALYTPRHLLQLVAVKRLQAQGLPLVAIQRELAGATDSQLERVARLPRAPEVATRVTDGTTAPVPAELAVPAPVGKATRRTAAGPGRRAAFWRQPPAAGSAVTGAAAALAAPAQLPPSPSVGEAPEGVDRPQAPVLGAPEREGNPPQEPVRGVVHTPISPAAPPAASLRGVRLGDGATLLLEPGRELDAGDVGAILEAAGPLLAALRARGLDRAEHRREHP